MSGANHVGTAALGLARSFTELGRDADGCSRIADDAEPLTGRPISEDFGIAKAMP